MNEILLLLIGGLITFFASYIVEWIKYERSGKSKFQSFILRIRLEMEASNNILEKLRTSLEYKDFFEFDKIEAAKNQIRSIEDLKKEVAFLPIDIQGRFLDLILGYSALVNELMGLESFAANELRIINTPEGVFQSREAYDSHFSKVRLQKLILLKVYKRKIDDLVRVLDIK